MALNRGDLAKAEEYCLQALAIKEKLTPDSLNVANSLNDLGVVTYGRDLAKAEEFIVKHWLSRRNEHPAVSGWRIA